MARSNSNPVNSTAESHGLLARMHAGLDASQDYGWAPLVAIVQQTANSPGRREKQPCGDCMLGKL